MKKEIKIIIPFTNSTKTIINKIKFNQGVERSPHWKVQALIKETEEDTNKWKDTPCSLIGRMLLKHPYYPKPSIDSMWPLWRFKWNHNSQSNFEKQQNRKCHISWFQVILSVQFSRSVISDSLWPHGLQYARLPCPCIYSHLIFDKLAKNTQWRNNNLFNKWCWENQIFTCKIKKKTKLLSITIHKNQFKME